MMKTSLFFLHIGLIIVWGYGLLLPSKTCRLPPIAMQPSTGPNDVQLHTPQQTDATELVALPMLSVILCNIQSGNNIGRICRNCLAFNAAQVLVVGKKDFKSKMHSADKGAGKRLNFLHFVTLEDARSHLKAQGAMILGVEITETALSLTSQPFFPHTAFIFGNEGSGLSHRQREVCDEFVYIPQFSAAGGMGSINVACASAVVLHSFASWAGFPETTRRGEKFM